MKTNKIVVESFINAPIEVVWHKSQDPKEHIKWDIRFSEIKYLESQSEDYRPLLYKTHLGLGISIRGFGKYLNSQINKHSTFEFWSEDSKSLMKIGKGIWLYEEIGSKTYFKTVFDYETNFGLLGRFLDKIFRPIFCLATEYSFELFRESCEKGKINPSKKTKIFFLIFILKKLIKPNPAEKRTFSWIGNGQPNESKLKKI